MRNSHASVEVLEVAPGRFDVRGALTFNTARRARDTGLRYFRASEVPEIEVSCAGVTQVDSAGLAVLLDWLAFAKSNHRGMRFKDLPGSLLAIARISEVESLLEEGVAAPSL